ncbi:MAG: hypothetical protein JWM64_2074 [Frankiales bacterium]|nr:hypothetical protein [Frankiales bacterium]
MTASGTRRPLQPEELPHLQALGATLRHARVLAVVTQEQLAQGAALSVRFLQRLEAGQRRTRASTLGRIAYFLALFLDVDHDDLVDLLVDAAGPALAPESEHGDKVAQRRVARARRVFWDEMRTDRLARQARRRKLPEERRQRARATLAALQRNARGDLRGDVA